MEWICNDRGGDWIWRLGWRNKLMDHFTFSGGFYSLRKCLTCPKVKHKHVLILPTKLSLSCSYQVWKRLMKFSGNKLTTTAFPLPGFAIQKEIISLISPFLSVFFLPAPSHAPNMLFQDLTNRIPFGSSVFPSATLFHILLTWEIPKWDMGGISLENPKPTPK